MRLENARRCRRATKGATLATRNNNVPHKRAVGAKRACRSHTARRRVGRRGRDRLRARVEPRARHGCALRNAFRGRGGPLRVHGRLHRGARAAKVHVRLRRARQGRGEHLAAVRAQRAEQRAVHARPAAVLAVGKHDVGHCKRRAQVNLPPQLHVVGVPQGVLKGAGVAIHRAEGLEKVPRRDATKQRGGVGVD